MKKLLLLSSIAAILIAASFGITEKANAQTTSTLVHYWNFNTLVAASRPVPNINADYSVLSANSAYLEYYVLPGTSSSWAAGNNGGDQVDPVGNTATVDSNARNGAVAGNAMRCRNPLDSAELRWHIPSTGFTNLVVTYLLESSSTGSGDSTQIFSYSVNGGTTWKTTGMTVNGANVDTLDVTDNAQYQGSSFGVVKITFGSDLTVNNNPELIFRITFRGNTHLLSGNNRFDDFTLDGVGNAGPPPPPPDVITMITPVSGSIFVPGQKTLISFHASSTTGNNRTIKFSTDSGKTYPTTLGIVTDAGDSTYTWTIPITPTTQGFVSVTDDSGVTAKVGPFIIYPIPANNLIVQYWAFNTLNTTYKAPNVPNLPADFAAPGTPQGYIQYVLLHNPSKSWAGYIDNVPGDTVDAHLGAWPGNGLRVRNPTDSMELHFVIPTKGFKGITLSYALQASSTTGPQVEHFTYSIDGGQTWIAKGITVNGSKQDTLDVTQSQYQQSAAPGAPYGHVTIGFDTVTSMDNNPGFVFRIVFGDTATGGTSGNNRFDNLTVSAASVVKSSSVNEPTQVQQQFNITPNPAVDNISFSNPFSSAVSVSVLDMTGRVVLESNESASHIVVNTSMLAAGSYYVRVQSEATGAEQEAKFIKQ
jgi:hypothetical protein